MPALLAPNVRRALLCLLPGLAAACNSTVTPDAGSTTGTVASTSGSTTATTGSTTGSTGTGTGSGSGSTSGTTTGAPTCGAVGASCATSTDACCGNLLCASGHCQQPTPTCAGFAELCSSTVPCCVPGDAGAIMGCFPIADGGPNLCLSQKGGQACGGGLPPCAAPYSCVSGTCNIPTTSHTCTGTPGSVCKSGDSCTPNTSASDPCSVSGLICYANGLCLQPSVQDPPSQPGSYPYDLSVCDPNGPNGCAPSGGGETTSTVCAPFFLSQDDHCFASCTTAAECGSLFDDCVQGACKPNYCYVAGPNLFTDAGGTAAAYLSTYSVQNGGLPLSGDPHSLFVPCEDAGFPTACLPQYDSQLGLSTGLCARVGGASNGGVGAPCDPLNLRTDPAGLCQQGSLCVNGTCLPWCDLGTSVFIQCPGGADSSLVCAALPPGSPLSSTGTGITNATGFCSQPCDPYQPASANSCVTYPSDGGSPAMGCKYIGTDSDISPVPGVCVGLLANPVALGQACDPTAWQDQCISGASCVRGTGSQPAFVCAQDCDPQPSPGVSEPTCAPGTTCKAALNCTTTVNANGACQHIGYCQ